MTVTPPPPAAPAPPPGPPGPSPGAVAPQGGRGLPSPFVAVVGYTLRACLPAKRWWGVLLPCLGAVLFGWLATVADTSAQRAFAFVAEQGLFGLVLPLTCLVIGDAILGADVRAGTFGFTWLSPVRFPTIVIGRWLGGWLVALVTLVPALVIATLVAGVPEGVGPMVIAAASGSAAYIGLFVMLGVMARRSAVWRSCSSASGCWARRCRASPRSRPCGKPSRCTPAWSTTGTGGACCVRARPTDGARSCVWRRSWWSHSPSRRGDWRA